MASSTSSTWLPELEAILRGLAHGISNRVAALSALVELGDAETAEGRAAIDRELRQLQAVNVLVKQLAAEPRPAEAMMLEEVCREAAALHSLRLDLRDVPCTVDGEGDVAVRSDRVRLVRLLLTLLARSARRAPAGMRIHVTGDAREARVRITSAGGMSPVADGVALASVAAELGARVEEESDGAGLVLPSLQELRRRENAG